ncbi:MULTISPECIES: VOC family protein [unclassified Streptomyces]|uniref:VOC family protein n=1 Tax=unclassified Streptomyces TaxID=2593676 RepID=UPI003330EA5C
MTRKPARPSARGSRRGYFASPDAAATAARVRRAGGEILMEPMRAGDFGTMCLARDPGGVVFGIRQGDAHEGFEAVAEPGAYRWAEVFAREPGKSDAFFPAVFPRTAKRMEDDGVDFRLLGPGDSTVLGRVAMTDDSPPEVPPHINVCFTVADCDDAVARATGLGGVLRSGPTDSPSGRFATLSDPQGANFSVIDLATTRRDMPKVTDVS